MPLNLTCTISDSVASLTPSFYWAFPDATFGKFPDQRPSAVDIYVDDMTNLSQDPAALLTWSNPSPPTTLIRSASPLVAPLVFTADDGAGNPAAAGFTLALEADISNYWTDPDAQDGGNFPVSLQFGPGPLNGGGLTLRFNHATGPGGSQFVVLDSFNSISVGYSGFTHVFGEDVRIAVRVKRDGSNWLVTTYINGAEWTTWDPTAFPVSDGVDFYTLLEIESRLSEIFLEPITGIPILDAFAPDSPLPTPFRIKRIWGYGRELTDLEMQTLTGTGTDIAP